VFACIGPDGGRSGPDTALITSAFEEGPCGPTACRRRGVCWCPHQYMSLDPYMRCRMCDRPRNPIAATGAVAAQWRAFGRRGHSPLTGRFSKPGRPCGFGIAGAGPRTRLLPPTRLAPKSILTGVDTTSLWVGHCPDLPDWQGYCIEG